jgi:uncharacterized membrane protein
MCVKFIITLMLIDLIWIVGNKEAHFKQVFDIQQTPLVLDKVAGLLFYILAGIGFSKFIKVYSKTKEEAFKNGALLGLLMYGTFDFTNKAIFTNYKWDYAIKDMLWGTFALGSASYLIF